MNTSKFPKMMKCFNYATLFPPIYIKKKTFAKNILKDIFTISDILDIHIDIQRKMEYSHRIINKQMDQLQKLQSLYIEYVNDPIKFIKKYDKYTEEQKATYLLQTYLDGKNKPSIFEIFRLLNMDKITHDKKWIDLGPLMS